MLAPDIDPVAVSLGPLKVHWYGLMYVFGLVALWYFAARRARKPGSGWKPEEVGDFVFYGAVPLAFVLRDPAVNGVAGAFLLATFYANGASFLGYAVLAAKRGLETRSRGEKSLYFTSGLLEGTETIAFFLVIAMWPAMFVPAAWVFGGLCIVTTVSRVILARRVFGR